MGDVVDNRYTASVVIPAHNEATVIGRLLTALTDDVASSELEIVVVCNGCVDDTADVVREVAPHARIVELTEASKYAALVAGDRTASCFPRIYIDADVVIDAGSVRALLAALRDPGALVAAPERLLDLRDASLLVRAYHQVWQRLPAVRDGLYGRGVLAISAVGFPRIAHRPHVIGDDLHVHHAFSPIERRIVTTAQSQIRVPVTVGALVQRRTRAALGNTELVGREGDHLDTTGNSVRSLLRLTMREPRLLPRLPVFVAVTVAARGRARRLRRRTQPVGWLRDESSRT